jgi:hypothetical protein
MVETLRRRTAEEAVHSFLDGHSSYRLELIDSRAFEQEIVQIAQNFRSF